MVSSVLHSGLYCTVTLQRNVGGGTSGARGGWLEAHGQCKTSSTCLACNDKGWLCPSPPHLLRARPHFILYWNTGMHEMGVFNGDCCLGGGGYACPLSPLTDRLSPAQNARNNHWLGPRIRPPRRKCPRPPAFNWIKQNYDNLMGGL